MRPIPAPLQNRPFTPTQARSEGVSSRALEGHRFIRGFRGVYAVADAEQDFPFLLAAARLVLPPDAAVSHLTNLRLLGYFAGPVLPLHFSTNSGRYSERAGLRIHRRQGDLNATDHDGQRSLGPMRTFVDVAAQLNDRSLARVGDWMLSTGLVKLDLLRTYVFDSHLDGVQRARRVLPHIRAGAASPRESDVRWELARGGLPEPELNVDIRDEHGVWLARGDLVYRRWKLLVEYDGWQHERDAKQRQWDHLRREQLEAAGWRVIVVTSADMEKPWTVVARVRTALRQRGCAC